MFIKEDVKNKWLPLVNDKDLDPIKNPYRRDVTIALMENTSQTLKKEGEGAQIIIEEKQNLTEAPANVTGANIANWDPILIPLIRRTTPKLIPFDTIGVQPMSGPTGLIFTMRPRYSTQTGAEPWMSEVDTTQSGQQDSSGNRLLNDDSTTGNQTTTDATNNPFEGTWLYGPTESTTNMEGYGDGGGRDFREMAFSIDKTSVTAESRALKAEYSTEMAQDLKAIHGLDAETELANILSTEIVAEINREIIRRIYKAAKLGAQRNVSSPGTFNLDQDSNGRWSVEKFKGLMIAVERDANQIAKETRRGRGNWIICSSDVATVLSMAGTLETNPLGNNFNVDDTGDMFLGVLNGKYKVFIDPYWNVSDMELYVVGYKGANPWDAGMFYAPYVPLQMVRAIGENSFQPKIGFKTRYGVVTNPFTLSSDDSNVYYRKVAVTNIM